MSTPNRPETLEALIFDLDGTLADTLPVVVEAFQKTFVDFGLPVRSQSEIFSCFGPTEDGVVKAMFGDVSARAIPVFYENYQRLLAFGVSPFPNMRSLLSASRVKGYRLAVVTGKSELGAAMTLDALGLADVFELIRGGSEDGIVKRAAMMEILGVWNMTPAAAAYVGDHPIDVLEARAVDVRALSAGWASTVDLEAIEAVHPDELFLTVEDLAAWLCVDGIMKG